jgi:hypothetical protein
MVNPSALEDACGSKRSAPLSGARAPVLKRSAVPAAHAVEDGGYDRLIG